MRLTEERIEAIAMAITDRLAEEELVDLTIDEEDLANLVANVITRDLAREDEIQREAVEFVRKTKPQLDPGSTGWSIELERARDQIAVRRGYVLP